MPIVPVELFRPIIKSVNERDKATLYSLVLSCHTLRAEAEQVLYRAVEFGGGRRRTSFLNTVVSNERLALHVRELNLFQTKEDRKDVYWDLHSAALRALTNLKSLNFQSNALVSSARILRGCSFQLERLIWGCEHDEKEIWRFLCTQQDLKVLSVLSCFNFEPLPSDAIPNLSVLMGPGHAIYPLMDSRKITRLKLKTRKRAPLPHEDVLQDLRVVVLGDYPNAELYGSATAQILGSMVNVEFLELICVRDDVLKKLPGLPRLKGLVVSIYDYTTTSVPKVMLTQSSSFAVTRDEFEALITSLFKKFPSLLFVDADLPRRQKVYLRWRRSMLNPIEIQRGPGFQWWSSDWELDSQEL